MAEAINTMKARRGGSPGQYRRAEAEELYKTGARGGCSRRCGRGCSRRMEQRRSRRRRKEKDEDKTDKIREPLTEVWGKSGLFDGS